MGPEVVASRAARDLFFGHVCPGCDPFRRDSFDLSHELSDCATHEEVQRAHQRPSNSRRGR